MNRYILILFKNMILMALILGTLSATSRANFESTFVQTGEFNRWWYTVETKFLKEILNEKKTWSYTHTHTHTRPYTHKLKKQHSLKKTQPYTHTHTHIHDHSSTHT